MAWRFTRRGRHDRQPCGEYVDLQQAHPAKTAENTLAGGRGTPDRKLPRPCDGPRPKRREWKRRARLADVDRAAAPRQEERGTEPSENQAPSKDAQFAIGGSCPGVRVCA